MINYFKSAEATLRARGTLDAALSNLERRKERIIRNAAPSEFPSLDMSKTYSSTSAVNDALSDCLELAEVVREISDTREKIEEIDDILGQLDAEDALVLKMWYIERRSKDDIAEAVSYASITSIYDARNKALSRFALLYFGAGAIPSM